MKLELNYKFLIVVGAAVLAVVIICICNYQFSYELEEVISSQSMFFVPAKEHRYLASLILDYGNGHKRKFEGRVVQNMTVLDALMASARAGRFKIKSNSQVEVIDGIENTEQKKWICYLNNKKIDSSPAQYIIKPRDRIECKYQ